jgi:hypothetical protein
MLCRRRKPLNRGRPRLPKAYCWTALNARRLVVLRVVAASVLTDPAGIAAGFRELLDRGGRESEPSLGGFEQV